MTATPCARARRRRLIWTGLAAAVAAAEVYGLTHPERNDTASEWVRWVFRIDTRLGRVVFPVVWGGFAAWIAWHIMEPDADARAALRVCREG